VRQSFETLPASRRTPYQVVVTFRAAAEIRAAAAWWRENRPAAPEALGEDLERAFTLLALQPQIGTPARNERLAGVRRVLLARVRYHLYYRVIESPPRLEVLALWHASRGAGPGLWAG
jgi:plasmid stabilization system protein ParE